MNDSPPPSSNWGFGILLVSLLIGSLVVATVSTLQVFQLRRENQALRFAQFQQQSQRQFVGRGAMAPGQAPDSFEVQRLREENMELQRMRSEVMQMREQLRQRDTVRPTTTTTRQTGGNAGRNNGGFRSGSGTSFAKNDLPARDKEKEEQFLAENKARPEVVTLPGGLQYKVLTPGYGRAPLLDETVTTHYRCTLIDGTEVDSSYRRGETTEFQLNSVIKGWQEALQLMPVGAKWQIFIPAALAYGERGSAGRIPGHATLIYEIELISIRESSATVAPLFNSVPKIIVD